MNFNEKLVLAKKKREPIEYFIKGKRKIVDNDSEWSKVNIGISKHRMDLEGIVTVYEHEIYNPETRESKQCIGWTNYVRGNIFRRKGSKNLYLIEKVNREAIFAISDSGEKIIIPITEKPTVAKIDIFKKLDDETKDLITQLERKTESLFSAIARQEVEFYIKWAKEQCQKKAEPNLVIHDEEILNCIKNRDINDKVLEYLYYLTGEELCQCLAEDLEGFIDALFMLSVTYGDEFGMEIVNKIEDTYQTFNPKITGNYWDNYALFSYYVLRYADNKKVRSFMLDAAARMLKYVAVNKDSKVAKKHIESLKDCVNWKYIVGVFE